MEESAEAIVVAGDIQATKGQTQSKGSMGNARPGCDTEAQPSGTEPALPYIWEIR